MDTSTSSRTARDWLKFTTSDYIAAKVVLGISVAGAVLFGLAVPILDALNSAPLPVTYLTRVTTGGVELPHGATIEGNAMVDLLLKDPTSGERLTQALPAILTAGLTITVAWLLFQLIRSTQAGEPFTRRNVWRINGIALMVGLGGLLVQLAGGVADNAIQTSGRLPNPDTLTLEMTFTPLPLVVMIVIALVGQAFRRGVVLREDVEGLV
jgi:Protein of unknown function (DUF2975)